MRGRLSGPMFDPCDDENRKSVFRREGGHYNIFSLKPDRGMAFLKLFFPDGEANVMNFALFSTSGIHGSYTTIEEIEASLELHGEDPGFDPEDAPDTWTGNDLTVVVVQPRLVSMTYGDVTVSKADIPYLKKLRESSWKAAQGIGVSK